jgi:hypothetical protein
MTSFRTKTRHNTTSQTKEEMKMNYQNTELNRWVVDVATLRGFTESEFRELEIDQQAYVLSQAEGISEKEALNMLRPANSGCSREEF